MTAPDARALALDIFHEVAAHVDGAALVRAARSEAIAVATHVLTVGKVAFPMLMGAGADTPAPSGSPAPRSRSPGPRVPARKRPAYVSPADHPTPTARSGRGARSPLALCAR